jgi:hypothetical protein
MLRNGGGIVKVCWFVEGGFGEKAAAFAGRADLENNAMAGVADGVRPSAAEPQSKGIENAEAAEPQRRKTEVPPKKSTQESKSLKVSTMERATEMASRQANESGKSVGAKKASPRSRAARAARIWRATAWALFSPVSTARAWAGSCKAVRAFLTMAVPSESFSAARAMEGSRDELIP